VPEAGEVPVAREGGSACASALGLGDALRRRQSIETSGCPAGRDREPAWTAVTRATTRLETVDVRFD
jgi:hypothetical protein